MFHSHFSGGLGVASACSTDAVQINICLFSLTPSLLVLKGEHRYKFEFISLVEERPYFVPNYKLKACNVRPALSEIKVSTAPT